jgi:hypothetical protein
MIIGGMENVVDIVARCILIADFFTTSVEASLAA